ncbi:MAG: exodeoxyribonuclease VII large subunit, partial [Muribaculaceae bacterium]|nr:exodeoxyribonuclease VII large subunit [Muribaculaceae bacterium]
NGRRLKFSVRLFDAVMQGAQVSDSVIAALDSIAQEQENWDCVCIIRGGGASTDLDGFDDYRLAANVAQFPLPIIVGIGHERDTTVLDYICACRVKTPTAAAELLVGLACEELEALRSLGASLLQTATDIIGGSRQQLAYISGQLPTAPLRALQNAERRLDNAVMNLSRTADNGLMPLRARLDRIADALKSSSANRLTLAIQSLNASDSLLKALSPQAVLSRGFSITRIDGKAVTDAASVALGAVITTTLASGTLTSTVS